MKVLGWFDKVKKEREGRGESVTFLGYNGILNIWDASILTDCHFSQTRRECTGYFFRKSFPKSFSHQKRVLSSVSPISFLSLTNSDQVRKFRSSCFLFVFLSLIILNQWICYQLYEYCFWKSLIFFISLISIRLQIYGYHNKLYLFLWLDTCPPFHNPNP